MMPGEGIQPTIGEFLAMQHAQIAAGLDMSGAGSAVSSGPSVGGPSVAKDSRYGEVDLWSVRQEVSTEFYWGRGGQYEAARFLHVFRRAEINETLDRDSDALRRAIDFSIELEESYDEIYRAALKITEGRFCRTAWAANPKPVKWSLSLKRSKAENIAAIKSLAEAARDDLREAF